MSSDRVYEEMETADETVGLNKIYADGQQLLAEKKAREAAESKEILVAVLATLLVQLVHCLLQLLAE